jgi:hypothetical protein
VHRTETRGAWMKLHEYALKESLILNPDALSDHDRRILLDVYEKPKTNHPESSATTENKVPTKS